MKFSGVAFGVSICLLTLCNLVDARKHHSDGSIWWIDAGIGQVIGVLFSIFIGLSFGGMN